MIWRPVDAATCDRDIIDRIIRHCTIKKFHNVAVSIDECASSDRSQSRYRLLLIYVAVSEPSSSAIFDCSGQIQT